MTSVSSTPRWVSWRAAGSIHNTLDLDRCAFGTPTPTRLQAAGRKDDAARWFAASAALDTTGETDAAERAAELL